MPQNIRQIVYVWVTTIAYFEFELKNAHCGIELAGREWNVFTHQASGVTRRVPGQLPPFSLLHPPEAEQWVANDPPCVSSSPPPTFQPGWIAEVEEA